jgi:hypothetical protein
MFQHDANCVADGIVSHPVGFGGHPRHSADANQADVMFMYVSH